MRRSAVAFSKRCPASRSRWRWRRADAVTERRARATRALGLQVERARYEADRAERAFHLCEPENRLVARSLEQRWESKLQALTEAEAAHAAAQAVAAPLPARDELEALAAGLPRLWNAPTSSDKDRKRLLRALIADVTLTSQPGRIGSPVHIGIHWRSGATEEIVVARPAPFGSGNPVAAVDLIKRMAGHADHEIVAELAHAGLRTGRGQPFDVTAVRWVRYIHRIPSAHADTAPGELTVPEVAARLHVGLSTVHYWIRTGRLSTRRTASGRYRIMFTDEVEEACRQQIARSTRIHPRTPRSAVGGAV